MRDDRFCRQAGFRQSGVEILTAAVAETGDDDAGQPPGPQAEFLVEDLHVKAFHRTGVDLQRGRAEQQGAESQVELLFHPGLEILAVVTMQVGIKAARLVLTGLGFRRGKAAILVFLVEDGRKVAFVQRLSCTKDDDVRGVPDLLLVIAVSALGRLGDTGLALLGAGNHEMPGLRVNRRWRVAQQCFKLFEGFGRNLAHRIEGLGRAAGFDDLGKVHQKLRWIPQL